jgi:hypothetical protein
MISQTPIAQSATPELTALPPALPRRWAILLGAAAAYNLVIGIGGLISGAAVNDRIVSLLVACFGLVYAIAASNPRRYAPMLWAGIAGKLGIIALLWRDLAAGTAPAGTLPVLAGDALFTIGFLALLLALRRDA